ncbi:ribosomal RNA processing protein 1 homolog B-like [Pseudoliparis swirei]|uniref:ribosomal RNA processing protein 1 homolog B-like n=1 Tax=Pseudoliparis swirei TaxID=2059687 RepID=UPI0024BE8371|nr:ribosomal RNA processing protein 1 homolog B-like [Pseudoliparis swirei]
MTSVQEPEVQLAQRLASNEKPVRAKAMKKLRKYIYVRSHVEAGGFNSEELLKLWKGLFYCLWMQDKPLLQEELSNQISSLIHSFQDIDGQLLYLESFLQTFKREWTGIDRLRMDKFFQLVRFMFRQTFEVLKRKNWDSSTIDRFLELLTAQLLQSGSGAPLGLQFHVLDIYMTELAAVGSAELTADQNLIFIEPFCKTAARTKDRPLFSAICNSMLSTIIDQAPFAIEDLMKELKAAEDSDSGQASEEDNDELNEKTSKPVDEKRRPMNGIASNEDEGNDSDDAELEESDSEVSCDGDAEQVLQFDYAALADKLFELASRSSTPSRNRQRLYKIIKVLRDLNEGVFPQDEYPEEVSTDEDDDMFGSRKMMMKRGRGGGLIGDTDEGVPGAKKSKGAKKEADTKQSKDSGKGDNEPADLKDDDEPADLTANENNNKKKKKKKRRKKKTKVVQNRDADGSEPGQTVAPAQCTIKETEAGPACDLEKEVLTQSSLTAVEVTEANTPEVQSETLLPSAVKRPPGAVAEESSRPGDDMHQSVKNGETCELKAVEPETTSEADASDKKGLKAELQADAQAETLPLNYDESAENNTATTPETDCPAPAKQKKKMMVKVTVVVTEEEEDDGPASVPEKQTDSLAPCGEESKNIDLKGPPVEAQLEEVESQDAAAAPLAKKRKKKKSKQEDDGPASVPEKQTDSIAPCGENIDLKGTTVEAQLEEVESQDATAAPLAKKKKKKRKNKQEDESAVVQLNKKRKNNPNECPTSVADEAVEAEITVTTPAKKTKKKSAVAPADVEDTSQSPVACIVDAELSSETQVVSSSVKPTKKKKRKIPVVFEYEADELEAASINGVAEEPAATKKSKPDSDVGQPSTPKKSQKKKAKASRGSESDFVTFQSNATVPTPLFCKTRGGASTPLSSKKKTQSPKSESKKVTFGLKNNKTAEFRKMDRSLLVSPDGSLRVPFDPKQKPKFGVLKSPPTPATRKTPKAVKKAVKKAGTKTPKTKTIRRPLAADFF